ncbi:hypothetical protein [Aeromicrobium sp. UC242_57]|uniref:hypothetical protein n=1 Tax=Aeromicrobium sp. UC242_57 TaxID=3374624 RepID=UPI003795A91E
MPQPTVTAMTSPTSGIVKASGCSLVGLIDSRTTRTRADDADGDDLAPPSTGRQ